MMSDAIAVFAWVAVWAVALAWAHLSGATAARRAAARRCPGLKLWHR